MESVEAKAVMDALQGFISEQAKVYRDTPLKIARIGINRQTWARLDHVAWYHWRRVMTPDGFFTGPGDFSMAQGLVRLAISGKHRVTHLRDITTSDWCELVEDVHLPDSMVELVYDLGPAHSYRTAGHTVDISALLASGEE